MSEKVRLSFEVSPKLNDTLEQLAERSDTTKSEILRKAIALMELAVEAKQKGQSLALTDEDKKIVTMIVGI